MSEIRRGGVGCVPASAEAGLQMGRGGVYSMQHADQDEVGLPNLHGTERWHVRSLL